MAERCFTPFVFEKSKSGFGKLLPESCIIERTGFTLKYDNGLLC